MARYVYTSESGTDFKVNNTDKSDAYEAENEKRQILDDLGELLAHTKFDDSYPKDGSAGGTLAIPYSAIAAMTSAQLKGIISDETGSSGLVFANTPTLVTPELGVATATSITANSSGGLALYEDGGKGIFVADGGDITCSTGNVSIPGGQLTFPATQNASAEANTLDDYEEGSWTPDLQFGGAKVDIAYDIQAGEYTKIGRQVMVTGIIDLSSKGSSSGNAYVYGLPFTSKNSDGAFTSVSVWTKNISFTDILMASVNKNTSTIIFWETAKVGGTTTFLTEADFEDNSNIYFSATYFTD